MRNSNPPNTRMERLPKGANNNDNLMANSVVVLLTRNLGRLAVVVVGDVCRSGSSVVAVVSATVPYY